MIEKFRQYIENQQLIDDDERVVVALSGGVDSMVLAELLRRGGYNIAFAHCNFHLRGEESDGDEKFVRDYAERVGVELFVKHFDTVQYAENHKVSIEMAARELRYAWFEEFGTKIALAHHADDQTETFFINLLRGSGIKGLKAMQPRNGLYIRPLLWASREEIKAFAVENDIQWREDRTNQETIFLRNKIRHELMPVFDEIKPEAREKIILSINFLASENQLYRQLLKEKISQIEKVEGVLHSIEKRHFGLNETKRGDVINQQLLFEWIRDFGFSFSQCESVVAASASDPGSVFYSIDYQLVIEKSAIEIFPINYKVEPCDISENKNFSCSKFMRNVDFQIEKKNKNIAQLDFEKLKFPLRLRTWQRGDRFKPLGMNGTKLVSDFFNDLNLSEFQKRNILILTDSEDEIIWIVGNRIDDRFKIVDKTKIIYEIVSE